jgi:hypothetical protein
MRPRRFVGSRKVWGEKCFTQETVSTEKHEKYMYFMKYMNCIGTSQSPQP